MNWNRVMEIARWEYMQKVRSKGFMISLILFPALILLLSFLPSILVSQDPNSARTIGIVDRTGMFAAQIDAQLRSQGKLEDGSPIWITTSYPADPASIDSSLVHAEDDARDGSTEGFLEIAGTPAAPTFIWRSTNVANLQNAQAVEGALKSVTMNQKLADAGLDSTVASRLMEPVNMQAVRLTEKGESESDSGMEFLVTFFTGFVGVILFMILIMTTGQTLVRGLVEEKSNRIMEILVGAANPSEIMWGKLIGLSGLGLTQALAWGVLGGLGALFFRSDLPVSPELLGQVAASIPYIALYLILGYFFFSAIFIGVGSLVTTEQEAQMVTQYLTMVLVLPLAFSAVIMQDPNATYVEGLSYVPFLTPTLMMLRAASGVPPLPTILATTAILLVSTLLVIWIAARIFRTAILLYGKRPDAGEILRWIRS